MPHFSKQEIEEIRRRLEQTAIKDSQFPDASVISLEDFVAIVQDSVNKKISVGSLFSYLGPEIASKYVISLQVFCENGSNMIRKNSSADMVAKVYSGFIDVTDRIPPSLFSWTRSSGNSSSDSVWNSLHEGVGPSVHITRDDINRGCTFLCTIPPNALDYINI